MKTRPYGKSTWKRFDLDTLLNNAFVVILILISVLALVLVRDFVGFVAYHDAKGGQITSLNIYKVTPATTWNGVYGIVLQAPVFNTSWYIFANSAGMSEVNPIYPCLEPGITHELYATTLTTDLIIWENVTAGTPQMVDDFVGLPYNDSMSATNTFVYNTSIEIGDRTISSVPTAYMKRYGVTGSQSYPVGILQYNGDLILVAVINPSYLTGYRPDKIFNFEMLVPIPPNISNLKYNLYVDPFDTCPEGQEGTSFLPGSVYGWVKENQTSAVLENAIVATGNKLFITSADGFFNISDLQPGDYYLVSVKTGFNNYVANITIIANTSIEHNISMKIFEEPLTGTGPGIGTGVGPGDDPPGTKTQSGVGPGVGPGIGPFLEKPQELGATHWVSLDQLKKKIKIGNFFTENILIFSFKQNAANIKVKISGNASDIIELSDTTAIIEQNKYANITVRGFGYQKGVYTGTFEVYGDFNDTIPIEITVTDEDKLPVEALLMQLEVLTTRPIPGNKFRFRVNLQNLLIEEKYDVKLDYYVRGVDSETANNTLYLGNDTISLLTQHSLIKELILPPEWQKGDYYLIVEANYLDLYSRTSTIFEVFEPLYKYKVFGIVELWKLLVALSTIAILLGLIIYIRHRVSSQKRFHAKVEYNLLPKKGPRSLFVGKIAETENDTYMDMDKLTVHSIIAGSTGGGKSISAQVIVEEALLKGVSVVVFDPTAQWSGMLRKCTDEKMLSFYPRFHLTKKDARAFPGNIRAIKNPREKIDLTKYWKPGEIQVFTTSTLDPKGMDLFVANTVREVFHSNLQEYRGLRMMMVYDEVHRLLPKFGGSGEGFIQIERACREFRKWGIGVMLVSQVLADFVGQIKANINTEIQMKTRDEGDLQRIETKYGKSYIQELVKAPVGSGMVQNSDWNRGKPYYITFRPILHSVVRLTDLELESYNKYNEMVDDLSFQLDQLEAEGKDVFDLRLELKLSLDKIKAGAFNMVEIYLEGLKPRIDKMWKDLGKEPKKKEMDLVSEEELKSEIKAAKDESAKLVKPAEEIKAEKKVLGIDDDVPPDKLLKLVNGTLVIKLRALIDEVKVLKEEEFRQHVNEKKNDFADWIRNAMGNDKLAAQADLIYTKEDFLKFLDLVYQGKEKDFKVTTPKPSPDAPKEAPKAATENKDPAAAKEAPKAITENKEVAATGETVKELTKEPPKETIQVIKQQEQPAPKT